ncbi:MAG TPA: transcription elongation factor GreA [Thermomicrobiales bacterium]|nr:transcription elongation factor GreA [Thermomicrobiales bacterium]
MDRSRIPMTPEGLQRLRAEYDHLTGTGRREMSQRIQAARELGDLRENAEYDTAKNDQGLMEARIRQLEDILRRAEEIAPGANGARVVTMGSTVRVDLDGDVETYTIVSPVESKPREGKISNESPVGKALLGHAAGERVDITMPNGRRMTAQIKAIE